MCNAATEDGCTAKAWAKASRLRGVGEWGVGEWGVGEWGVGGERAEKSRDVLEFVSRF
jgi:hypothetical protein